MVGTSTLKTIMTLTGILFIRSAGSNVWLGLIHTDDGFHRWADGAIMTFENFGSHDQYDADHQCVFLNELTGQWQHELCTTPMEYVCMRPKLQLYDARTANASRPRATVEIWRRIEEALVPARAPALKIPKPTKPPPTTKPPVNNQGIRTSIEEEVDEGPEKISAGISTDTEPVRNQKSGANAVQPGWAGKPANAVSH